MGSTKTLEGEVQSSVIPLNFDSLMIEQKKLLQKLDSFEAPNYLEEKLRKSNIFESHEEYLEAFREFKRFVGLRVMYGENMSMTSKEVDEVWHQFILFTKQYHEFCGEMIGRYLHHQPKTSQFPLSPEGRRNFVNNYRNAYGEIPSIWNLKTKGDCIEICTTPDCDPCSPIGCNVDPDPN